MCSNRVLNSLHYIVIIEAGGGASGLAPEPGRWVSVVDNGSTDYFSVLAAGPSHPFQYVFHVDHEMTEPGSIFHLEF